MGREDVWVWECSGILCVSLRIHPCSSGRYCVYQGMFLIRSSGNLDLAPVLPFLGKTQLQILSFLTSAVLMVTHSFTSWAVSERVLLRDE